MTDNAYAAAQASAANLALLSGQSEHDAAVVLGSGWASAADELGAPVAEISLAELGGFPRPTVTGHAPVARSLLVGSLRVLVYLGRTRLYEGHPVDAVVHGVRTAAAAGCRAHVTLLYPCKPPDRIDPPLLTALSELTAAIASRRSGQAE